MNRYMRGVIALLAGMLVSCGGGGGGDGVSSGSAAPGGSGGSGGSGGLGGSSVSVPSAGAHVEESDAAVTLTGTWTDSNPESGWSGGSAKESTVAGSRATMTFNGKSVTWFGSRGRRMGIALVSIDGGPGVEVDLSAFPYDEIHSPAYTVNGLSDGTHTLTIEVTGRANPEASGNVVVVDAFDVQGQIVSHLQQSNLDQITYSGSWTDADPGFTWSGGGISNLPELPLGARMAETAGARATLEFRGTSVSWIGYRGPDAGIARVQVDGGAAVEVDMFSPARKVQEIVFTATGLADARHTLTIEATGRRNDQSTRAQVVVDAFDVRTPGRRYQEWEPSIDYSGFGWVRRNAARVWSEGASATSKGNRDELGNVVSGPAPRAVFRFTGTGVSWISSAKSSLGEANVYLDGVFQRRVVLWRPYPHEAYQWEAFRADGLTNGPHTLTIEVIDDGGGYVVIDAFDVRP